MLKPTMIFILFFATLLFAESIKQYPLPIPVPDNNNLTPRISLNGGWKVSISPPEKFWQKDVAPDDWQDINVPGELRMQGVPIEHDKEAVYKISIDIPEAFRGKKVFIRFDGVYNYARLWINGNYVKEHFGGFTPWDCDINRWAKPGETVELRVGVTDRADDISMGSGYAKHLMGGIIRDVTLMAMPFDFLNYLKIDTDFDASYNDASLNIEIGMLFEKSKKAEIRCRLESLDGKEIRLNESSLELTAQSPNNLLKIPVKSPLKWDVEHPNLYVLKLDVSINGKVIQSFSEKFGFRQVKRLGNKVFVNGREIKLRGANRHSIHPTDGRVLSANMEKQDVLLAKEANMNFIRTSHYPPTDIFLDYCDEYGLYVEDETAVTFVNVNHDSTQNSPEFASRYLSQVQEMVTAHYNHPSVIAWSIGNESVYGENFQLCFDWLKSVDENRPVVLSYPATIPDSVYCTEFLSVHYPFFDKITDELTSLYDPRIGKDKPFVYNNLPILYDEWAHVPAYNIQTIKQDPNVRNFWGHSIDAMWRTSFTEDGRLGGAIWCMIDDVFNLPTAGKDSAATVSKFGNGEWGIVDAWRRKKPEFWHTRKGYSPIYIDNKNISLDQPDDPIELVVQNRFDHTNFTELDIVWASGEKSGVIQTGSIEPHTWGVLDIPAETWQSNDSIYLKFYLKDQWLVDEFLLPITILSNYTQSVQADKYSKEELPAPIVDDKKNKIILSGRNFKLGFDKKTGLITQGEYAGRSVIQSGPFLQLLPLELEPWSLKNIDWEEADNSVDVTIQGSYGQVNVSFMLRVRGDGSFNTEFKIENPPPAPGNDDTWWPRYGYREVGVAFLLDGSIDQLSWKRKALWTVYPKDHIGRPHGSATRYRQEGEGNVGSAPKWSWSQDMQNPYSVDEADPGFGATNDFRSQKEYITTANIYSTKNEVGLRILSDGTQSIRLEPQGSEKSAPVKMIINTDWDYPDLGWGCFMKEPVIISNDYKGTISLSTYQK